MHGGAGFVFRARGGLIFMLMDVSFKPMDVNFKPMDVNVTAFHGASFLVAVQNHAFSNFAVAKQVQLWHPI